MTRYAKLIAALVGAALEATSLGLVDQRWVTVAIAFLTAAGVYRIPNAAE